MNWTPCGVARASHALSNHAVRGVTSAQAATPECATALVRAWASRHKAEAPHANASKPALGRRVLCKFAGRPGARGYPAGSASWKSPVGRGGRHRAGRADTRTQIFHLPAHVSAPMPEIETALDILAVDNAREITCSSLRSRPQSRRHSQRMKSIGPVSGVHLRKRWIASQYVVFSGGRCAPTIRVRPAGRSASSRASSGELGSSSRCWTSAPPVAGPRFSITKG